MIVFPDQDAVLAITSQTDDMQKELNLVWKYLLPAMDKESLPPNDEAVAKLKAKISSLAVPVYKKSAKSSIESDISGKKYLFKSNSAQLQNLSLKVSDTLVTLNMKIADTEYALNFKHDSWYLGETELPGPNLVPNKNIDILRPFKVAGSYTWLDDNSIELTLRYIESPHTETITCIFLNNKVGVSSKNIFSKEDDIRLIEGILEKN